MKTLKTGGREIRLHNRSRILEYVYMSGQTTKQQLVEALGMSQPTVIQIVKELLNEGLFRETGQLRSTGGGWQDQAGGMIPGVKLLSSAPGAWQEVSARRLSIPPEAMAKLTERFCLIYTGQRRPARGLLREVMGRYIAGEPEAVAILRDIQSLARDMARALEAGDIEAFSEMLSRHWELSKRLDAGGTNTCIDLIFVAVSDLISGRMICGAGGGGYLQVVMKEGVTLEALNRRLSDAFPGTGVAAWSCDFDA